MIRMALATLFVCLSTWVTCQTKLFPKVNLEKSSINWVGKKVTGQHEGTINLKSADFICDDKGKITGGTFVIDMTSIVCTDIQGEGASDLVGHLSNEDFFHVSEYPTATLKITDIQSDGFGFFDYYADLTIKDTTHPINFFVEFKDGMAMTKLKVDRTKYGIKYGSASFFDNLKDKAIDNDFMLEISLNLQ